MLALTQRNMYIQWEREEKKKLDIVTQKNNATTLFCPDVSYDGKCGTNCMCINMYLYFYLLQWPVNKFIAHGSSRGIRVTAHARCNVCVLTGEFNTVYICEPRFWKCHEENSQIPNLFYVSIFSPISLTIDEFYLQV